MEHVTGEPHLGGAEGVVWGETKDGREHTALKTCVLWSPKIRKQETILESAPIYPDKQDRHLFIFII